MVRRQNDYAAASEFYHASLAIFRTLGDEKGIADTLLSIGGIAWEQGNYEAARSSFLENLAIQRELGSKPGIGHTLMWLGVVVRELGDYTEGRRMLEEALTIERELGFRQGIGRCLMNLGSTAIAQGDPTASQILEEGLTISRELGARWDAGRCLHDLGQAAARQGEYELAHSRFASSLAILREHGDRRNLVKCLEGLAGVAVAYRQTERGARLFGASEALRERLGTPMPRTYLANYKRSIAALSAQVNEEQLAKWWAEGRAMPYDQAIEYAVAEQVEEVQAIASAQPHDPNALTPREIEVLRLAQAGLSDAKIAEKLVISTRTVNTHLSSIYSKLGVNSRRDAARYALDHKLI
jgi:DNA-binding CsgD family transcriptional regulator